MLKHNSPGLKDSGEEDLGVVASGQNPECCSWLSTLLRREKMGHVMTHQPAGYGQQSGPSGTCKEHN